MPANVQKRTLPAGKVASVRRDVLVLLAVILAASLVGLSGTRPPADGVFTVDGVALGMIADEVLAIRGEPLRRGRGRGCTATGTALRAGARW